MILLSNLNARVHCLQNIIQAETTIFLPWRDQRGSPWPWQQRLRDRRKGTGHHQRRPRIGFVGVALVRPGPTTLCIDLSFGRLRSQDLGLSLGQLVLYVIEIFLFQLHVSDFLLKSNDFLFKSFHEHGLAVDFIDDWLVFDCFGRHSKAVNRNGSKWRVNINVVLMRHKIIIKNII